jgi:stage II sporulation protein P
MDHQQRSLGIGSVLILTAVILRLLSAGAWEPLAAAMESPETAAFLLYLETGRVVHPQQVLLTEPETLPTQPPQTQPPPTQPAETAPREIYCFAQEDAALVDVTYHANHRPDLSEIVISPLRWELEGEQPTVLILHSHATECYLPDGTFAQTSPYRTLDTGRNVVSMGALLADLLEQGGIRVLHDTALHDHPAYNEAYSSSRRAAKAYLQENSSLLMVLDLHRDGVDGDKQPDTSAQVHGQESAQLMMVVGTKQEGWEANMALAVKLTAALEKLHPA